MTVLPDSVHSSFTDVKGVNNVLFDCHCERFMLYLRLITQQKKGKSMIEEGMSAHDAGIEFSKKGLSEATLRRWSRIGKIRRIRNGVYSRKDVFSALYPEMQTDFDQSMYANKPVYKYCETRIATPEDAQGIAVLTASMLGGIPHPERWASWIKKNPDVAYVGVLNDLVIACGFLVPHTEEKILSILSQEITPPTSLDEILDYCPGEHVCVYARTICVAEYDASGERYSYGQWKTWAGALMLTLVRALINFGARGVIIDKLYGRADSKHGERAMHDLGMTEIRTTTSHRNFVIDFSTSGLNLVLRYDRKFLEWERAQAGE